jgi:hypothetical protein
VCGITNGDPSTTRSICSCLELAPPPVGDILTCTSKLAVNHNSQSQPHALRLPALGALKGAGRDTVVGSRTPLAFFFLHRGDGKPCATSRSRPASAKSRVLADVRYGTQRPHHTSLLLLRAMAERRAGAPLAKEQIGVVGRRESPSRSWVAGRRQGRRLPPPP